MNCIPAIVEEKKIYLTTPSLNSKINPAVVYAAKKCGVKKSIRLVEPDYSSTGLWNKEI